ncbi:uncharacterized protein TNCV_440971 [Trichonephila clavipes]|nr:uncharacterized protein TNCV_440971 [Trichonephila clavipes]
MSSFLLSHNSPENYATLLQTHEAQAVNGSTTVMPRLLEAAVAEWSRYKIMAGFVTSSTPVPLKTRRVGEKCTLNLSRAQTTSRWCGVAVRRGG